MNDFDNLFSSSSATAKPSSSAADPHRVDDLGDILGGSARFTSRGFDGSSIDLDSMYSSAGGSSKHSSFPVFDKPLYDDDDDGGDIFDSISGMKSSTSVSFDEDVFSISRDKKMKEEGRGVVFDDLLGGFGKKESELGRKGFGNESKVKSSLSDFDDLIPGFSGSSPHLDRSKSEATWRGKPAVSVPRASPNGMEDPAYLFESDKRAANQSSGLFTDPYEERSKLSNSQSTRFDDISVPSKRAQDDMDPFDDLGKSIPSFSSESNSRGKYRGSSMTDSGRSPSQAYTAKEPIERSPDSHSKKSTYADNDLGFHQTLFGMPPVSTGSYKPVGQPFSPPSASATSNGSNIRADISQGSEEKESTDDIWLMVSEIPLYTQPTSAPPPSRPPPPIPVKRQVNTSSLKSNTSFQSPRSATWSSVASIDEFEEFARERNRSAGDEHANGFSADDGEMNSIAAASAAAMKEAMDRAETKFRHAREARERDNTWDFRSKDSVQVERDENQERFDREQLQKERDEEEREQRRQEKEREERESEHRRLEKERERAREIEKERVRQAVERATREARERAAVGARLKAERAAVDKAERAAVQRAQAEARGRAAAGAKVRAEKAAAESRERERAAAEAKERERAAAEAREKTEAWVRAERAAVERAAAEARARAAAEARERASAAAKANQQRNDNDLESFFSMGRPSSAPRPRPNFLDPFDTQFQSKQGPEPTKTSASSSTNIRKASSSLNIVDDLSSIFRAAPSSGDFQDIEGESEERRRARLERHQRTQERAAKALAEKNQRDLQVQWEQAERHRIAETLDVEIRRWAAGKEGNLRALLSTMQYVLWPECGWQPVSLTDLITAAAVKKSYRKATLCIHPDKVQQKGANLQQKYIAEKVFDLLKEAWNKFNSEELF